MSTTHETPRPSRRRFPLTATSLVLGVLAAPVYFLTATAAEPEAAEGAAAEPVVAVADTPSVATTPAPDASVSSSERADSPAPPPAPIAADPSAKLEVAPAGRGAGAAPSAPRRKRVRRKSPRSKSSGSMAMDWPPAADGAMMGEEAPTEDRGYDPRLQANRLTAGRTSDLQDTSSLDELRSKATARDPQLARAIDNHAVVGPMPGVGSNPETLDIAFVLDTTGSMGDEMNYLKVEMRSIAETISQRFPGVTQRYGLVAYKDDGDAYVVRHRDFVGIDAFVANLGAEHAGGGGDFPEALDRGMQTAGELSWSPNGSTRMVFVVADAPPHQQDYDRYVSATQDLALQGVSVYPVASSGAETTFEYLMRWAARTTGGEYIFLTDHSGIGNAHADPHVDQYEVKTLRDHMLEVIDHELSTTAPGANEPQEHRCGHAHHGGPSWWERHQLFLLILAGVFAVGFAGDMARHHVRRTS